MEFDNDISHKIKALHGRAHDLLKQNYDDEEIVTELSKTGITQHYARTILDNVYNEIDLRKQARNLLISGIGITVMGLAINLFSLYNAIKNGQSSFWLLWGIVVAGIIMIIKANGMYRQLAR